MRKLAREAVIFMLLTSLVFVAGSFVYLYHDAHKPVLFDASKAYSSKSLDLSAGLVPKPTSELLGTALLFGLYGFPAGFGLWVFYRVVRFAVKG